MRRDLNLTSTCQHAVPPRESGPSALAEEGGGTISLTLQDDSGDIGPRTVTFMGRAH